MSDLTSKIIEWDDQKGFGYLRHQKGKLFLHRKDFAERHKRPGIGDRIHYQIGTDPKGRRCAVKARHVNDGGKITALTWLSLILLMALPTLAMGHFMFINKRPLLFLFFYVAAINLITYLSYKSDKDKARSKQWRTAESSLHILEFIGGWPAALLAQRQFRHKCSKVSFQITYWLIVLFYIGLAIDYLLDWAMLKTLLMLLTPPES